MAQVTIGNEPICLEVEYVGAEVVERQWEIIGSGVRLQSGEGRERKIGRGTVEIGRHRGIPAASCLYERGAAIQRERGHSGNHNAEQYPSAR